MPQMKQCTCSQPACCCALSMSKRPVLRISCSGAAEFLVSSKRAAGLRRLMRPASRLRSLLLTRSICAAVTYLSDKTLCHQRLPIRAAADEHMAMRQADNATIEMRQITLFRRMTCA